MNVRMCQERYIETVAVLVYAEFCMYQEDYNTDRSIATVELKMKMKINWTPVPSPFPTSSVDVGMVKQSYGEPSKFSERIKLIVITFLHFEVYPALVALVNLGLWYTAC